MKYLNHILTPNTIILMFDDGKTIGIYKKTNSKAYYDVLEAIEKKNFDRIPDIASIGTFVENRTDGKVKIVKGKAVIDGEELPQRLGFRLLQMVKRNADISALLNFWRRLKKNPSDTSVNELYSFLEHNHVPIMPDGHFIAYKSVRTDFLDVYSGQFDNSPGQVISMPREMVDPNRNQTCSTGLHVAAFNYAKNIYSGDVLLEVAVDPQDVVSVPTDYNEEKMRVCKYKVLCVHKALEEIKDQVKDRKVKPVTSMSIKVETGSIRVTKPMLGMIPKPKEGEITPLYVCVHPKKNCVLITRKKPNAKVLFEQKYDSTSSVSISKEALFAAQMTGNTQFSVKKVKHGIKIETILA